MLDREATTLPKWPFFAGDLLLVGVAVWIVWQFRPPADWHFAVLVASVVTGALFGILPFVLEHRAKVRLGEVRALANVGEHMTQLRSFTNQMSFATAQWQVAQEQAEKTVAAAREIAERVGAEAKAFSDFLREVNEKEKRQLHLELEKVRKGEGEWLQVTVRLLDHVFALHQAAVRSAQPRLVEQLGRFQHACRDAVRRVGLVPFEPLVDDVFNEQLHQLNGSESKPEEGARVKQTIAPGFNYQGRLLRPALVDVAFNGESHGAGEQAAKPNAEL